jgi:hypothetical protein
MLRHQATSDGDIFSRGGRLLRHRESGYYQRMAVKPKKTVRFEARVKAPEQVTLWTAPEERVNQIHHSTVKEL